MNLVEEFVRRYGKLPTEFDKDYLELVNMSKYKILDSPFYQPGKCANCGSTKIDGRKYIDFGLEIDWYGKVYLCNLCLENIAMSIGLFEKFEAEVAELHQKFAAQQEMLSKDNNLAERLTSILEEVKPYLANVYSSGNVTESDRIGSLESSESVTKESDKGSTGTSTGATKSTSSSRSKNVPRLADLL